MQFKHKGKVYQKIVIPFGRKPLIINFTKNGIDSFTASAIFDNVPFGEADGITKEQALFNFIVKYFGSKRE